MDQGEEVFESEFERGDSGVVTRGIIRSTLKLKRQIMSGRYLWIEEYKGCGCSSEAGRKKDLLGYCATHGSSRVNVYKLPLSRVESFEKDKEYIVMRDYEKEVDPFFKVDCICWELKAGQELRFRGPNFGNAEFLTLDGTARVVMLKPRLAFSLVGKIAEMD